MPRQRDPRRAQAYEIWKEHKGKITNRDISKQLDVPEKTISAWKSRDKWNDESNVVLQKRERSTTNRKKNTKSKRSGNPHPENQFAKRNNAAVKHGFFQTIFPDDEETHNILDAIQIKSPLDMIWESIVIQYTAIARAQKLMFVQYQYDLTKELKKVKPGQFGDEEEYEIQFAWDKHANFLQAQSRAFSTLESFIKRYEAMLPDGLAMEEQRLKLEKLRAEIETVKNPESEDNEQWVASLKAVANKRRQIKGDPDE